MSEHSALACQNTRYGTVRYQIIGTTRIISPNSIPTLIIVLVLILVLVFVSVLAQTINKTHDFVQEEVGFEHLNRPEMLPGASWDPMGALAK